MTFLGIIAGLVLIAIFWRQLAGLALVVVVAVGLLFVGVEGWKHVEDYRKRGNWTLTFTIYGDEPVVIEKLATREACEAKRDAILETTRKARNGRDMWKVSGWCN